MMDAVNEPGVWMVVFMTSAQVGKSEVLNNTLGYYTDQDPCPVLFLHPTLEMAEAYSKDRLAPMFRDTPALKGKIKDARARDSGNTLLQKKFPGGHITLAGANSPASLASRPIRIVLCDEVDRYPQSAGTEGDPVSLAQKRTSTFYNRKIILASTPTIKGASRIESAFETSDKRRYHVPCTECGKHQVLKFSQLKWADGNPETTLYLCEHCNQPMSEAKKPVMLRAGKWVAEAPWNGIAGFHLNELYSPWRKWSEVVADFLRAKGSVETLKTWVNTALGETWEQKGEAPEWRRLYERREDYPINRIPSGVVFLTAGADVQRDRIEVEVVGWGQDKQSWSIDYRVFPGDTSGPDPWRKLDELLSEHWIHPGGSQMAISILAVDTGFNTQVVYNWARKYPLSRVMAVKGVEASAAILSTPSAVDVTVRGQRVRRGFKVWPVAVNLIKSELYGWLKLDKPVDGEAYPAGYCHFPQYGEEYFKQLTSEHIVRRIVRGFARFQWEKTQERNEALDCRVYARAAAAAVGLDRLSPEQFEEMARELASTSADPEDDEDDENEDERPARRRSFWNQR